MTYRVKTCSFLSSVLFCFSFFFHHSAAAGLRLAFPLRPRAVYALRAGAIGDALGALVEFCGHDSKGFFRHGGTYVWQGDIKTIFDALRLSGTRRLRVTDDTIMTELVVWALYAWYGKGRNELASGQLMETIAQRTLNNYLLRNSSQSYSWADADRAPGVHSIRAVEYYQKTGVWNRSFYKRRAHGKEAGSGKVMSAAGFGLVIENPDIAAQYAAEHALISHPDVVSQAACAAIAYAVALGMGGERDLSLIVEKMKEKARAVSAANPVAEQKEWRAGRMYWPRWRDNGSGTPYTVADRITDVQVAMSKDATLASILAHHQGWGAPDLVGAVAALMLFTERQKWTVKEAVLAVVNVDSPVAGVDRDTVASVVGQVLVACSVPLGFAPNEFDAVEKDAERNALGKSLEKSYVA